jgi:hypothetical protein
MKNILINYGFSLDKFRFHCAKIINNTWFYSMHWGKEPERRHWTMDAKHDCITRISEMEKELLELKQLRKELEEIAKDYIPGEGI